MPSTRTPRLSRSVGRPRRAWVRLHVQCLEERAVPAASPFDVYTPVVSAGSPRVSPADTPADRVDANSPTSPYAGVGSIQVGTRNGSFVGTGAVIGSKYVLTAAHVIDANNDGKFDRKDGVQGMYFILNTDGDVTYKIAITEVHIHPDFNGFNAPAVNDDLAILTLAEDLPADVPSYGIGSGDQQPGTLFTVVGYGRSGDGVKGYTTPASATVKRVGENVMDAFIGQDDPGRPEVNEVFRFDFDGPTGNGPLGGPTLGNGAETTFGPGDSGAPIFGGGGTTIVGVAAFTQGNAPRFGSMGGGALISPYGKWLDSILHGQVGLPVGPDSRPPGQPPIVGVEDPLPPASPEPTLPLPVSKGGAGARTGANALRARLSAVSFPPAQERPPAPPPPVLPPALPPANPELPPVIEVPPPEMPAEPVVPPTPPPEVPPVPTLTEPIDPRIWLSLQATDPSAPARRE
jgi:hypothetical protein